MGERGKSLKKKASIPQLSSYWFHFSWDLTASWFSAMGPVLPLHVSWEGPASTNLNDKALWHRVTVQIQNH
jgi:hypothetical protein